MARSKQTDDSSTRSTLTVRRSGTPYFSYSSKVLVDDCYFQVVKGPHKGMQLPLHKEILHIGRQEEWCDLVLADDPLVSARHARILVGESGIRVMDLESRNGVFLERYRICDAYVTPGNKIQIGNTVLSLRANKNQQKELKIHYSDESGMLAGRSPQMRQIFSVLSRLKDRDIPILLSGETGTGKTSIAQALHLQSNRKNGPFVVVNCGALSPSLIESSLFGHEKGAFTGAIQQHQGYFEQAKGGTLFLDELGELPLELQPRLLDVLERRKLQRLGGTQEIETDFRLLAATHRELAKEVQAGRFREDLFYRLSVINLEVPPLRERLEDLPLLVEVLLTGMVEEEEVEISQEALQKLEGYLWPGNVRQLRNVLQRALAYATSSLIGEEEIIFPNTDTMPYTTTKSPKKQNYGTESSEHLGTGDVHVSFIVDGNESLKDMVARTEKGLLLYALNLMEWNVPKAAVMLEISPSWLYKRIEKYSLKKNL